MLIHPVNETPNAQRVCPEMRDPNLWHFTGNIRCFEKPLELWLVPPLEYKAGHFSNMVTGYHDKASSKWHCFLISSASSCVDCVGCRAAERRSLHFIDPTTLAFMTYNLNSYIYIYIYILYTLIHHDIIYYPL